VVKFIQKIHLIKKFLENLRKALGNMFYSGEGFFRKAKILPFHCWSGAREKYSILRNSVQEIWWSNLIMTQFRNLKIILAALIYLETVFGEKVRGVFFEWTNSYYLRK